MKVTGYKLQVTGRTWNLQLITCNHEYLFFKGKCTQIFKPTETNMEFYLRKRYRQR